MNIVHAKNSEAAGFAKQVSLRELFKPNLTWIKCSQSCNILISIADLFANELKVSTCSASKTFHLLGYVSSATELQQTSAT